jgi:hypothetical protein
MTINVFIVINKKKIKVIKKKKKIKNINFNIYYY